MIAIKIEDINNITSESGVIASLIHSPEFIFYSENLLPNHFCDRQNAYMYLAITILTQQNIDTVDAYNIINALESGENTRRYAAELQIDELQDFIDMSDTLARRSVEEYKMLVSNVLNAALRRDTFKKLRECEALCLDESEKDLEQKIYASLDDIMMEYSTANDVPPYADIVDDCWDKIKERQGNGYAGIPFKFPALNEYATLERGELFIFAAEAKQGKSMMLLNCAVDMLKKDLAILYLDSELNSRLFTARILSHLTGIEFKRLTAGNYSEEEERSIIEAKAWLKTRKFTHIYIPMFDQQSIYTAVKKVKHTQGLDVLIVDYFKGKGEGDAFDSYQELGRFVDMVKNQICGEMNIAGLGAAQATATGKVADSAKIGRNASTIAVIRDKTPEEIDADGPECGNKKLSVILNRNGMQMAHGEYIDLQFNGNIISYEQAKQHMDVWRSIRDNTTLIFQWESNSAQQYMKKFMSDETLAIARSKIPNFSMLKWMSFGNGLLRPACASFRDSVANGEFYDNGFDALNEFLAPEAGRIAMQETIMQFLVKFCGYSAAESDNVRRAIAKKKGTETLLPEIENRFVAYCSEQYDMTVEQCENIIKPFLQIILDASAYGFSWNHSDAYSAIGYVCGYLRYYHPLEFLTSALNIFGDNQEKTAAITSYAKKVGIQVTMPKWGLSRGVYFFDRERNIIAKGLSSIKYMSAALADELYALSKEKTYTYFVDLLYDLDTKTSINSRQLDILIQLDFFSDFGNQRELLKMNDMFNTFKKGEAKQIKKSVVDGTPLEAIVKKYAVGVTKSGGEAKSYTLLDVMSILKDTEDYIKGIGMDDISDLIKVRNFYDVMGYIGYVSGKETDRRKLYVTKIVPLHRKSDGKQFGYSVFTKSIGSGVESRFTVFNSVYNKEPIREGDIIYCKEYIRDGAYFKMTAYEKVF